MSALKVAHSLLRKYAILYGDAFVVGTMKPSHDALPSCRRCFPSLSHPAKFPFAAPKDLIRVYSTNSNPKVSCRGHWLARLQSSSVDPLSEKARKDSSEGGVSPSSSSPGDRFKEAFQNAEKSNDMSVSNYWGITPKDALREDGTNWPWHCFKPGDAYISDTKIDLTKHHIPDTFVDKFALWTVKALRWPTDLFFQKRYGCRAMMLETVAAVPGMVGGMLLHFRSLRRFEYSGGWIKALLEEAENERMHLMTFMEVAKPHWYERLLVVTVQGIFFNAYFLLYILSPRLAHRITGYLEEEAIYSYTSYLKEIDNGHLPNGPAPAIAIDYWRLPKTATIRDVVVVVRADEAHHRDVNHFAADVHEEGKKLKDSPAPVGYH